MKSTQGAVDYKVLYAKAVFGDEEKQAVMKSLENGWLAAGPLVAEFENKIAKLFGHKYGVATNSGSSANLLALASLNLPKGSEVITPACTFSTCVSTIIQNNLVPVFIDSVMGRYTLNENLIEQAITPKTRAIFAPHLIGGVVDLRKLREIADIYHLIILDDSCDTLGITIDGKPTGFYSDLSTTSFYGSHIITAMGYGGMVCTSNENIYKRLVTLKDWGRVGGDKDDFEERFNYKIDDIPYDVKFLYSEFGYNLKMNEGAAAFGLEQLKRLDKFKEIKNNAFKRLFDYFKTMDRYFYLPKVISGGETSWLAFPLTIKKEGNSTQLSRITLLRYLERYKIQTRVLFSGNITRHPAYRQSPETFRISSKLDTADQIMADSCLVGCHQGMTNEDVDYIISVVDRYLNNYVIGHS